MRPLISFDWAIKRLLRQKANYNILEGFLSTLLKEEINIINIPESESNSQSASDKINKVDILCETSDKKLILVELQYNSENDYFHRMFFGTSKIIVDYLQEGEPYEKIKKVISINIVYFDLGQGEDYVYHGTTDFRGIHNQDILILSGNQKKLYQINSPKDIFAEYYIIKVNKFNDHAKDSLDEWIFYLKNNNLPRKFSAKGLNLVSRKLKYDAMKNAAKKEYDAYQKELAISYSVIETAKFEGREEGYSEGLQKGIKKGMEKGIEKGLEKGLEKGIEKGMENEKIELVIKAFKNKIGLKLIANITGLSLIKVKTILRQYKLL